MLRTLIFLVMCMNLYLECLSGAGNVIYKKNNEYATVLYDSEKFIPGKENLTLKCLVST